VKGARQLLAWSAIFAVGLLAGRYLIAVHFSREIIGVAMMAVGVVIGVAPSLLLNLAGKTDQPPPKEFSRVHAERIRRKLAYRRRVFYTRYFMALGATLVVAIVGAVLRFSGSVPQVEWFTAVGIGAAFVGVLVSGFAIQEFFVVTRALRGVAEEADDIRRRNEILKH
jgi:hypothetical protein